MKKVIFSFILMMMVVLLFAEVQKVAILAFEKQDRKSDYVANSLNGKRFQKKVFKDFDGLELISLKETAKIVEKSGYSNLYILGKEQISEIGKELNADILVWGNVTTINENSYKINAKILSMKSLDVISSTFNVKRSSKDMRKAFGDNLLAKIAEFAGGEVDKISGIAIQHYKSKNYAAAEESFLRVLEMDEKNLQAYFYLGLINYIDEEFEESEKYYLKGLEIEPENSDILDYLSNTYMKMELHDKAIETLEKISEIEESKDIWFRIGNIYLKQEFPDEAIESFRKAIEIDEEFAAAYAEIGKLLFEQGEFDEAIEYLEFAVKEFPEDDDLQKKLAKSYKKTGKIDDAIAQYLSLIEEQPDNLKAYMNLANSYTAAERFEDALQTTKRMEEISPENPQVFILMANSYSSLKNYDKAVEIANKTLSIDETLYQPYRILSEIYQAIGYKSYVKYLDLDEKSKDTATYYGEQLDNLITERDNVKETAHSKFLKSKQYLDESRNRTSDHSEINYIETREETLKQLLDATKKDFF